MLMSGERLQADWRHRRTLRCTLYVMADADDEKSAARARREAAHAQAAAASGSNRNIQILAGTVFAALVVVVLIVVISGGSKKEQVAPNEAVPQTKTLLAGLQQNGFTLGDPKAPLNLVEFLDVQCPYCAAHEIDEQPTVIQELVRTGKATLTMQPIDLLGGDSQPGRVVAARMATKNKAWDFVNLWYLQQGNESTGYATPQYLNMLATQTLGKATSADSSTTPGPEETKLLAEVDANRKALKISSTPSFAIGRTGQPISSYKVYDTTQTSTRASEQLVGAVEKAGA